MKSRLTLNCRDTFEMKGQFVNTRVGETYKYYGANPLVNLKATIVDKDNNNRYLLMIKPVEQEDREKYYYSFVIFDDISCVNFYGSGKGNIFTTTNNAKAFEVWEKMKDQRSYEEIQAIIKQRNEDTEKCLKNYTAPKDVSNQWARYNEKHK